MQLFLQFLLLCVYPYIDVCDVLLFFDACEQQLLTAVYSTNSNIRYNKILTNLGVDQPISVS